MDIKNKTLWTFLVAVILASFIVPIAIWFVPTSDEMRAAPLQFQSPQWKSENASTKKHTIRSRMVDDFLAQYNFTEYTAKQLEKLLGEPYPGKIGDYDLVYFIGRDRGYGIDFEWLAFCLDESGEVKSYKRVVQ